ncbi:DUF1285 domain-containing protein [Pistricoccus aurantiacus]|nr:DUF1285 domain-containing protein [Pistricoccus aurantiacus]
MTSSPKRPDLDSLLAPMEGATSNPPLEQWHPPLSGDMDLVIDRQGNWHHDGSVMRRPQLVRLLATLLRREADGDYYLVTPAEKWRLRVEDRPLVIVDAAHDTKEDAWWLVTSLGDRLRLDESHFMSLSEMPEGDTLPEVVVRHGLGARLNRNVFYRLVEQAEQRETPEGVELGLTSGGAWHPLGRVDRDAS